MFSYNTHLFIEKFLAAQWMEHNNIYSFSRDPKRCYIFNLTPTKILCTNLPVCYITDAVNAVKLMILVKGLLHWFLRSQRVAELSMNFLSDVWDFLRGHIPLGGADNDYDVHIFVQHSHTNTWHAETYFFRLV